MRRTRHLVPAPELPDRYQEPWRTAFVADALDRCWPGMTILDVGGGAMPTLPAHVRPTSTTYIGLDPSARDLERGDYDLRLIAGASDLQTGLVGTVDLILSWMVFEHIPDMTTAFTCFHAYLKPGGCLMARFAGRWAFFAVAGRLIPYSLRLTLLSRLLSQPAADHFPTHYRDCTPRRLQPLLADWSTHEVVPYYRGATYFEFSRVLQHLYLSYEALAMRSSSLATHYEVKAVR